MGVNEEEEENDKLSFHVFYGDAGRKHGGAVRNFLKGNCQLCWASEKSRTLEKQMLCAP